MNNKTLMIKNNNNKLTKKKNKMNNKTLMIKNNKINNNKLMK